MFRTKYPMNLKHFDGKRKNFVDVRAKRAKTLGLCYSDKHFIISIEN